MRRWTTVSVVALASVAVLAGCGSSKKTGATSTTPTGGVSASTSGPASGEGSSAAGTPADAATTAAVTKAYTTFFGQRASEATKLSYLEDAASVSQLAQELAKNPSSTKISAKVDAVTLTDPTHAIVTYDLLTSGTVVLKGSHGKAVRVNGQWKVAKETFCALASLAITTGNLPGCS
jgi:hypothetical protein